MKTDDFLADYERVLHAAAVRRLAGPRRRRVRAVPLVIAAAALAIALVLVVTRGAPAPPPGPADDERPAPTATADPRRYSVLDRPPSAPLPRARIDGFLEDPLMRAKKIEWDRAVAATSGHDVTVYVAPTAKDELCLISASTRFGTGVVCATPSAELRAITHRFTVHGDATLVAGLIPDGADTVDIVMPSGEVAAPVRNNAFVARIGHEPASVRWRDAAGTHREELAPSPRAIG